MPYIRSSLISRTFNRNLNDDRLKELEDENESLRLNNRELSLQVNELKMKNGLLQKDIDSLHEELFLNRIELNRYKTQVTKFRTDVQGHILPDIIKMVNWFTNMFTEETVPKTRHSTAKTQAVAPQIVNGNVLYNPTISLRRFDDRQSDDQVVSHSEENISERVENENSVENSEHGDTAIEQRLNTITEETENSIDQSRNINITSTFYRDVKIFLNPLSNHDFSTIVNNSTNSNNASRNGSLGMEASNISLDLQLSAINANRPSSSTPCLTNIADSPMEDINRPSTTTSLATSTPIMPDDLDRLRKRNLNSSCFVTKKRGHLNDEKVFSQQVNNCSNENGSCSSNSNNSTLKEAPELVVRLRSMDKENIGENIESDRTQPDSITPKKKTKKSSTKRVTKVKEEIVSPITTPASERPKRKAKPTNLKEPTLQKKMRRSK